MADFDVHGLKGVNPVNGKTSALHAAEPRHLALGKLMDGYLEALEHLVVGETACDVFGDEFVFETVVDEVVGRDSLGEKAADFVYHAFVEAGFQTSRNLRTTLVAVDINANNQRRDGRQFTTWHGMLKVIRLNLNGADGALAGVDIGLVVHVGTILGFQRYEHLGEFVQRTALEAGAELRILRNGREVIALEHSLDVKARAATENGHGSPTLYSLVGVEEVLLILEEVVLRARLADVDEVVRDIER